MIASIEAPLPDVQQLNFDGTPFYPEEVPQQEVQQQGLIAKLGDMATRAVITAQIKAENAISVTTNYLKREGLKVAAHATLAGLAVAYGAGVIGRGHDTAEAATGPNYTVASTAVGGVYSRNTPHNNDTPRITGRGAYPGDVLTLECGVTNGDPVQPYNNHTWYYAHDNNRNEPDFWINDHYMNTPNAANQMAPGVPHCANESSNPMAQGSSSFPVEQAPAQTPVRDIAPDRGPVVTYGRSIYINFSREETDTMEYYHQLGLGVGALGAYACSKIPVPLVEVPCSVLAIAYGADFDWALTRATDTNNCLQLAVGYAGLNGPTHFGWARCLD